MTITTQSADGVLHQFPDGTANAVVDRAMQEYAAQNPPPAERSQPGIIPDMARAAPGGLLKGVAGVAGLPGNIRSLMDIPARFIAEKTGTDKPAQRDAGLLGNVQDALRSFDNALSPPTSADVTNAAAKPFGGLYEPQTTPGKYAETIASFLPAGLAPGGIAARLARIMAPGVASEAAGEATAGTPYEPVARLAGGVAGGFAVPAAGVIKEMGARAFAGSGPTAAAQAAHDAGFVLPPNMISDKPGVVSQAIGALSGKIKLQQAASARNQETATKLATEAIGLPGDTPLNEASIGAVRKAASADYQNVASAVPQIVPDYAFQAAVVDLGKRTAEAAKAFPGIVQNKDIENLAETLFDAQPFSPQAGLELVRHLRSDASANLKAFNDPSKQALGLAQRHAAEAVDNLIERNLTAIGKPDLVNNYRDARQLLARTYDVEAAMNPGNGDVNPRVIAALSKKGRPMSGQLKDIADAAMAFPKAMQSTAGFGGTENLGILDAAVAATHPGMIPALLARPGARSALLSAPYQRLLMRQPVPLTAPTNLPIELLRNLALSGALSRPNALGPKGPFDRAADAADNRGRYGQ